MLIAVLDESSPQRSDGVIIYALGAVVMSDGEHKRLTAVLPSVLNRQRPFHWEADKGPVVRKRVIDEMCASWTSLVLAAMEVVETKRQDGAREELLHLNVLPTLARLGVERLEIESRSANEDSRDLRSIRNWYREQKAFRCPQLAFVHKAEPVACLAG